MQSKPPFQEKFSIQITTLSKESPGGKKRHGLFRATQSQNRECWRPYSGFAEWKQQHPRSPLGHAAPTEQFDRAATIQNGMK